MSQALLAATQASPNAANLYTAGMIALVTCGIGVILIRVGLRSKGSAASRIADSLLGVVVFVGGIFAAIASYK